MNLDDLNIIDTGDYGDIGIVIDLLSLVDAKIIRKNGRNGSREEGIFIPIHNNSLVLENNECLLFAYGKKSNVGNEYSHYIKQYHDLKTKRDLIKKNYSFKMIGKLKTK